ncbi:MAG: extradiol ring-cleavage dioxygenase [Chloroflexi bacterium]|nr:extradiol ring-cleavage dioxygenase [Chloroflexota bacterium]
MAQVVFGIGSSHSPQLSMAAENWHLRGESDKRNNGLIGIDGIVSTYDDLLERRDDLAAVAKEITPEVFKKRHEQNQRSIQKLSEALYRANPDILVMVGDDQQEYLRDDNMPSMAVYWGDDVLVKGRSEVAGGQGGINQGPMIGYFPDDKTVPTSSALGRHLVEFLIESEFDMGRSSFLDPNRAGGGIGHAFGYVYHRLMTREQIPTVPIMLNTYYPPNQPTPKRCYDLGRAIRSAIEAWPTKARVAILASGGLSHFVVDEPLDYMAMDGIKNKDIVKLSQLPRERMNSGNSEIRNWIVLTGATEHLDLDYLDYVPCYRSPAGTGCAMAFAEWS